MSAGRFRVFFVCPARRVCSGIIPGRKVLPASSLVITPETVKQVAAVAEFKGRWEALGQMVPNRLKAIARLGLAESIGAALRLSGMRLTDRQAGEFLSGSRMPEWDDKLRRAAAGYRDVLSLISKAPDRIAIIPEHVIQIRGLVCGGRGDRGADQKKLAAICAWLKKEEAAGTLHPVLLGAVFFRRFLDARVFDDGNSRVACVLLKLFLLRHRYFFIRYSSLEHHLEIVLQKENFISAGLDATVNGVLKSIIRMMDDLTARIEREQKVVSLPAPSRQVVDIVRERGRATISQIQELTGANRNTLKIRLRKLVKASFLEQHGRGKGTYYTVRSEH